jgi:hypothetical protein
MAFRIREARAGCLGLQILEVRERRSAAEAGHDLATRQIKLLEDQCEPPALADCYFYFG